MFSNKRVRKFIICLISTVLAFMLAIYIRFSNIASEQYFFRASNYQVFLCVMMSMLFVCFFYPFEKINRAQRSLLRYLKDAVIINGLMLMIFTSITYLFKVSEISRGFSLYFFIFDTIFMFIGFILLRIIFDSYIKTHKKIAFVFASKENHRNVIDNLMRYGAKDTQLHALVTFDEDNGTHEVFKIEEKNGECNFIKKDENYESFLRNEIVDEVFISLPQTDQAKITEIIKLLDSMGIASLLSLADFEIGSMETRIVNFGDLNVIEYAPRIFTDSELIAKRILDIVGSIIGCILCIIVGIFVIPAIFIEDPGPVIFKQKRVGRNARFFDMYKFRSMYQDAESRKQELMANNEMEDNLMFKMENDPRITKVGKFIRKTSLDEFPQFFNVLMGDMSLVGTRPPTVDEFKQYSNHHRRRLSMKPGITGLWQISGRSDITSFEEVVRLDCHYIDNWSLFWDIKILIQTVFKVIRREGSK